MNYGLEHARAAQRPQRRAAERRYALALTTLAQHKAQFLAMGEHGARPATLLEFLGQVEQARKALAEARAALINAAWADGTLTNSERLDDAVEGLLLVASR